MKKNIGISDRIIRFVLMDFLMGFSYVDIDISLTLQNLAFMISLCLLLSIISGYSLIYHLLGIDTCYEIQTNE